MNRQEILKKAKDLSAQSESTQKNINKIRGGIESKKLEAADLGSSETATLKEIREDLQAEVALGEASPDQLNNLDDKIKESESFDKQRGEVFGSICGLERKLEEAENNSRVIANQIIENSRKFVTVEAEAIGAEYIIAAQDVCRLFRKLQALSSLTNSPFKHNGIHSKFFIPSFMLESHAAQCVAGSPTVLSDSLDIAANGGNLAVLDSDNERQRLASIGVVCN